MKNGSKTADWWKVGLVIWLCLNAILAALYVLAIRFVFRSEWTPSLLNRHAEYTNRLADKL